MEFARIEDETELEFLIQAAIKAIESHYETMKQHAALTINYLGKSLGGNKTS